MIIERWDHIIHLGSIIKTHGFDGAFIVSIPDHIELNAERCHTIFIDEGTFPVPFAIKNINEKGDSLIVRLQLIGSQDEAKKWIGRDVFVEKTAATLLDEDDSTTMLDGFSITDEQSGYKGTIIRTFEYSGQWMLELEPGTIWIPLASEYFIEIDEKSRHVTVCLPEGLIDLQ